MPASPQPPRNAANSRKTRRSCQCRNWCKRRSSHVCRAATSRGCTTLPTSQRCPLAWWKSNNCWASGYLSATTFQIHGAPSATARTAAARSRPPTKHDAPESLLQLFLICLVGWIRRNEQNAIEYLREETNVLKEQMGKKPRFNNDQGRRQAAKAKKLGLEGLKEIAAIATPRTPLACHQRPIARKYDGSGKRSPGRPPTPQEVRDLDPENGCAKPHMGLHSYSGRVAESEL